MAIGPTPSPQVTYAQREDTDRRAAAIPGADANELVSNLDGVAAAAGAACHSGKPHVSDTLRAMGVADGLALCTVRLTVGRPTTAEEVDLAAERICDAALKGRGQ